MFEHSVRVPRHYKVAANIFKKVATEGGSVKTLLYDNKLRHFRTNVLYALITETVKHAADIDKIFESSEILKKESRLDPWLAKILTAELLFGKKALPGISKPEQTILAYKEQFEQYTKEHQDELKTEAVHRPRYVRINTNLLITSDAIRSFQDEGYKYIRCTSGTYNDYLQQLQSLTEYSFLQDYHIKTIFVFPHGTKLHEHELYLENQIILQDKATALAVHLLAPPAGSVVLDMCAAPGMKTTQVAALMKNEGKVYAVERNEKRFQTLTDFVNNTGCKCVELIHRDALEIKRGEYDDVEYILLDPSCSGSGMEFSVHNYIEESRLAKLTSLQEKFLKHAMNAFPKAKRIVYSTCSLFPEENERVITNVVKNSRAKWRVQDVKEMLKGQWNNFGSGMYGSMGTRCLYARPESDFTTGFFLAVLDRDAMELDKAINGNTVQIDENKSDESKTEESVKTKKITNTNEYMENICEADEAVKINKKKNKQRNIAENIVDTNTVTDENGEDCIKKKTRKEDDVSITESEATNIMMESISKKKNKKRKQDDENGSCTSSNSQIDNDNTIQEDETVTVKKKKKKKKTKEDNDQSHDIEVNIEVDIDEDKRKKKRRNRDDEILNADDSEVSKVNIESDYPVDNSIDNENNIEGASKKKKKKRNKDKTNEE